MSEPPIERKLAAIFAADIASYSRMMARDEVGTVARLKASRRVVDELIATHRGRIFNTAGDSVVADFASAVDAVACAVAVQHAIATEEPSNAESEPMRFRIGVHVGDVMVDGTNLLGDAVNIAARLEAIAVPGGICVSAAVHDQVGNKVPVAFIDLGEQAVKNIAQPIRAYRIETAAISTALPLPDKPSIAVLPFQNMSHDPEQEYFVDGMVEEIITVLSRIRRLFVIARNSSFTYKGQSVDIKLVGRELGVRYVLEGSVRRAGNRVRITGQLIDTANGAHIWADHFDGSIENVFELQDKVAASVAGVIEPALQAAETARSATRPTNDLTVYDLYLRAYAMFRSSGRIPEALQLFEQAIARDPSYGPALAWAAVCCVRLLFDGRSTDPEADRLKSIDFARRALDVGSDDPDTLANAAYALAYFGEDIGAMMALVDRALAFNPNYALGWSTSGLLRNWAGQPDIAITHLETSLRLNPRGHLVPIYTSIGMAHFLSRRFDEAVAKLLLAVEEDRHSPVPCRGLAACYAHMGRPDDAREVIARLRTMTPVVIPDVSHFRNPEHRKLLLSGLQLAMDESG